MVLIPYLLLIIGRVVLGQYDPNCGGRNVIVHLFEWKWTDVAAECERFLSSKGFCGVQVSPPAEHISIDGSYPWWQRYQPVSYKLFSRSGTEAEFIDMVERCNAVGVRIYVDAVFNHMTGGDRVGTSPYANSTYDGGILSYPAVPYNSSHFTPRSLCPSVTGGVDNYQDPDNVRNCQLVGLTDLYGASADVQDKVAAYLNRLVDIGVAGIRVDAAKHMWPEDIGAILAKVNPLPTSHGFPPNSKLFVYQDVIDFNNEAVKSSEYFDNGYVMEYRYSRKISDGISDYSLLYSIVDQAWNMSPTNRAFVFVDTHDSQRDNLGVGQVITHRTPSRYKQATAFMLAHPYGLPLVMSSYNFSHVDDGPPGTNGQTADVVINADGSCAGGWICEHRWKSIANMVSFSNSAAGKNISNYWNDGMAVAFSREGTCFFAMAQSGNLNRIFATGLPEGSYCNLVDDCATRISVNASGSAQVVIDNIEEPFVAFCVGDGTTAASETPAVSSTTPMTPTSSESTATTPLDGTMRTVIFIYKFATGKEIFIRGGIDHVFNPNCTYDATTSSCAIPISINSLGTSVYYAGYNAWSAGDTELDWYGPESGQGSFLGIPATGTPLVKTSNNPSDPGYQPLNKFGDDYWMVDMNVDCTKTLNGSGWFEVRAFIDNTWEENIEQSAYCPGNAGGSAPFRSTHHVARCGYLNLFYFESNSCEIEEIGGFTVLPTVPTATAQSTTDDSTTEPTTETTTSEPSPFRRTVIFLQRTTLDGEFIFIRGGIEPTFTGRPECQTDPDLCTIPISVRELGNTTGFDGYNAWREGDTKLDWIGREPGQGSHGTILAEGTPMIWSTNDTNNPLYQPLNTFGDHYWMVDMDMDCSATENNWFEVLGVFRGKNESVTTESMLNPGQVFCTGNGTEPGPPPLNFGRHIAYCGRLNVFLYNNSACQIYSLDD